MKEQQDIATTFSFERQRRRGVLLLFSEVSIKLLVAMLLLFYLSMPFHLVLVEHRWDALLERLIHTYQLPKTSSQPFDQSLDIGRHFLSSPSIFLQEDPCLASLLSRQKYLLLSAGFTWHLTEKTLLFPTALDGKAFTSIVRYRLAPKTSPPFLLISA